MAARSIFRDFITALEQHWRTALPTVRPLTEAHGSMPKASTFYAGIAQPSGMHVFLYFQAHKNQAGKFTINVVLPKDEQSPRRWFPPERTPGGFGQGPHRIGQFVGARRGDKWWQLKRDEGLEAWRREVGLPVISRGYWSPESYDDEKAIIQAADTKKPASFSATSCGTGPTRSA